MLAHNKEGKLVLEDADGSVELDFTHLVYGSTGADSMSLTKLQDEPGDGLFVEGCFALVEGEYTPDGALEIIAIGQPPCEPRDVARYAAYLYVSIHALNALGRYTVISTSLAKAQPHFWKMCVCITAHANCISILDRPNSPPASKKTSRTCSSLFCPTSG